MLNQLIIATHNAGKLREIAELLAPLHIAVSSAAQHDLPEPVEDGDSFSANALIKSQSALKHSGLPSLADDSGLVVPLLDGAPGIYSARWAGESKDFGLAMQRLQRECADAGEAEPEAYFICVLALSRPNQPDEVFEGRVYGRLRFPPSGERGFGYDPVFIPAGHNRSFAEIDASEKQRISHRSEAFGKLLNWLKAQEAAA